MESLNTFPHDYRVNEVIQDKCGTIMDLREHLETCYAENVTAEFAHVKDEEERLWLHQNYEEALNGEVNDQEKIKSL